MKATIKIQKREVKNSINAAQGFNVQKISELEAVNSMQGKFFCPCYGFKSVLGAAGLEFNPAQQLKQGEEYKGYVAVYVGSSSIVIFYLAGTMWGIKTGSPTSFSGLQAVGKLFVVENIKDSLARGLKNEYLDEETVNKAYKALEDGTLSFDVSKREQALLKSWMGDMLSFY